MRIESRHRIGIILGLIFLIFDFMLFSKTPIFVPFILVSVMIIVSQFWLDFLLENRRQKEIEEKFPEFVRNFVGSVSSGMSPSVAMINVSKEDYGALSPYVRRLGHQLDWAVPFHKAFRQFAKATGNQLIKKAVSTVIEAESYGGNIEDVLKSVTDSLIEIKKIKSERRASINSQMVQSYIIFVVFLAIVVVIQNFLMPYMQSVSISTGGLSLTDTPSRAGISIPTKVVIRFSSISEFIISISEWMTSMNGIFLMLSLTQAFFSGLVLGLFTEGNMKYGIKHSVILMIIAFLTVTLSQGFVA
jgi:flagellar protein FlaJ